MQLEGSTDRAPRRVLFQTLVGDVRLVLQGAGRPTDSEIDQHIKEAVAMAGFVRGVLVIAVGPDAEGPDARQRARMASGLLRIRTAVVTDSVLARGIMTAVSWLGGPIRGFAPEQLLQAFDYLKVSESVRTRIPLELAALKRELRGGSLRPDARSDRVRTGRIGAGSDSKTLSLR
jgi:hypothetical protein